MKVILIILDGWGIAPPSYGNAITSANTPTIDSIEATYPSLLLQASGIGVGLPWGHEGNSEVGHLNIGSGRIVLQYLPRIIEAIRDGSFFENKALKKATTHVKKNNSSLHLMGLVSSGSVHSYIDHLYGLLELAKRERISNVYIHIFTDGKDGPMEEASKFISQLNERLSAQSLGRISTIIGRTYAMDRSYNWEYTKKAYLLLTKGIGEAIDDPVKYLKDSYEKGTNDAYIEPALITQHETQNTQQLITEGDAVIFFNFREDRARQLTRAFIKDNFKEFSREKIKNFVFVSMTKYEEAIPESMVAFPADNISNSLTEILSSYNKKQLHIAESEKYAHITYFFNGMREKAYEGEERIFIPSQESPHYEKFPEMQAPKITENIITNMNSFDFMLVNFANADILAHTGNMQAAIKGIEAIDFSIKRILKAQNENIAILITSDHGNAEEMIDPKTGAIRTEHTSNPVPFYLVRKNKQSPAPHGAGQEMVLDGTLQDIRPLPLEKQKIKGILSDVAPTILELMELPIPEEMNGQSLLPLFFL